MSTDAAGRRAITGPGAAGRRDARAAAFDALPDAAAVVDATGRIVQINRAWAAFGALNGGDAERCGVGADYLATCRRSADAGSGEAGLVAEGLHDVLDGRLRSFEHRYPCSSPVEDRWFVVRIAPLEGGGAVLLHLDVTSAKHAEDLLAHRAFHDPLTGLPNREAVMAHLRAGIARLRRTGAPLAALFLDLDGFKPVNDRYGHEIGDWVLARVANRLQHQLRATDIVGRVGGDEFLAVCDAADARVLAQRLRNAVSAPLQIGSDTVTLAVSIGMAVAADPRVDDPEEAARALLSEADRAMYAEKRDRPDRRRPAGGPDYEATTRRVRSRRRR